MYAAALAMVRIGFTKRKQSAKLYSMIVRLLPFFRAVELFVHKLPKQYKPFPFFYPITPHKSHKKIPIQWMAPKEAEKLAYKNLRAVLRQLGESQKKS